MLRAVVHLLLHVATPAVVAKNFYHEQFWRAFTIMLAALIVDLDHLLADPIYDPGRCSIGFHPLHQYPAIAVYCLLAVLPKTRLLGIGLLIHMLLDGIDCAWMAYE